MSKYSFEKDNQEFTLTTPKGVNVSSSEALDIYNEFKNRFILIESTYDKKHTIETDPNGVNTPWMSKWHNLENVFKYDYDKIFLIDSDVIFYKNPNYIFNNQYND